MNSLDKLLTNTTNRFQSTNPIMIGQCQSNFTPIQLPQHQLDPFQSKNIPLLQHFADQNIPQTYEQLQERYNELIKTLQQAKHEKRVMSMLFEKVFLVEQGKEQQMKRRFRRKKTQIQGKYACQRCSKIYSSATSLARHAKLKHSYSTLEPPLVKYQIPPEPNSINQSCQVEEFHEAKLTATNLKREKPSNESQFNEFDSCQNSSSLESDSHAHQSQSQGLS